MALFDDYSIEEKLLVCALVKNMIAESHEEICFKGLYTVWEMMGRVSPILQQFLLTSEAIIQGTGLGEDMISNAQISKYIWDNMSLEHRRRFLYVVFELLDLPAIKGNLASVMGISSIIKNTLNKVDDGIRCNVIKGEFICEQYGIHTQPIK